MRPEARGQRPDPNPDPGNQSICGEDRKFNIGWQDVQICQHKYAAEKIFPN